LSKVIKSFSVNIQNPRVIELSSSRGGVFEEGILENAGMVQGNGNGDSPQDIERVRDQAGEILRETEEMVKDLLATAREEAEKIIKSANEEARRIVSGGQEKLKQIEEDAFKKGWQTGYDEGIRVAETEYDNKLQEAVTLVDKAHQERKKIIAGSEDEIVQLAVAVARKIIQRELSSDPEIIVGIVKRAIQKATDREELTIRVNPDNLDSTLNSRDDITQSVKGVRKLKVLADPGVAPGGCVVESPNGTVDARVERQLSEIEQALMEVGPNA